jgi:hypothetical protein
MKQQILLLLIAASLLLASCQKEVMPNEKSIVSKANFNAKNAENNVPFIGDYITTARFPEGSPAHQIITGHGQATHIGKSMFVAEARVNFSVPPPFPLSGTAIFTAANGDQFFTQFTGTNTPTGPGTSRGLITHTITGGTGRFENATGTLIGVALVNAANPTNTVSYEGWINY